MDRLVDFMQGDVVRVSSLALDMMEEIARSNTGKKRYRICLHDSPKNRQHEMIICTLKGDYGRPHKHVNMSETHVILKGKELIVFFDRKGDVLDSFVLDINGGELCYRINADIFHMSIPLTETVIELESKGGPFNSEDNVYAIWAPDGNDNKEIEEYVRDVLKRCAEKMPCSENNEKLYIDIWREKR